MVAWEVQNRLPTRTGTADGCEGCSSGSVWMMVEVVAYSKQAQQIPRTPALTPIQTRPESCPRSRSCRASCRETPGAKGRPLAVALRPASTMREMNRRCGRNATWIHCSQTSASPTSPRTVAGRAMADGMRLGEAWQGDRARGVETGTHSTARPRAVGVAMPVDTAVSSSMGLPRCWGASRTCAVSGESIERR